MTTAETHPSRADVVERLAEIGPYPADGSPHALAVYLAADALRRHAAVQRLWKQTPDKTTDLDYMASHEAIQNLVTEFASLELLLRLIEVAPALAGELATQIRDAWDDDDTLGERLSELAQGLGIDPEEVIRLEQEWWALPDDVPAGAAQPS